MKLKNYPKHAKFRTFNDAYCQDFEKNIIALEAASPDFCQNGEKALNENFEAFEAGFQMHDIIGSMIEKRQEQNETMTALQAVTLEIETLGYHFEENANDPENIRILLDLYTDHQKKLTEAKEKNKGTSSSQVRSELQIVNYLAHLITERALLKNGYKQTMT